MNDEIDQLQKFTVDEFQENFDELMSRVENGESFLIESEHGSVIMVPYNEVVKICEESDVDFDDIVKVYTDQEEGS
jgi:transposase